jgi:hypothetical protein
VRLLGLQGWSGGGAAAGLVGCDGGDEVGIFFSSCERLCCRLGRVVFWVRGRSGVRRGVGSLGVDVAGFSFVVGREAVAVAAERMSDMGEAGRLPRMACSARQLEREMKATGLDGGGVGVHLGP